MTSIFERQKLRYEKYQSNPQLGSRNVEWFHEERRRSYIMLWELTAGKTSGIALYPNQRPRLLRKKVEQTLWVDREDFIGNIWEGMIIGGTKLGWWVAKEILEDNSKGNH